MKRLEDVLKTSFVFIFRRRLDQDEYVRPSLTSSEDVFKTFSRRLQDVFKTFSRNLQDFLQKRLQDIFKTPSRRLQDVLKTSSRHLQDVFKTHYQVKVFLVTQIQDIFETYSKRFWDVLLRRLSTGGLPRSHFREIYGHCAKFPRVIKISQVLIFHFTTPFSSYTLQRRI